MKFDSLLENDLIKGVVHIVDYNNEFLQVQLYRALFLFESNLRKLLAMNGKTNDDFIEWIKDEILTGESKKHWTSRLQKIIPKDEQKRKEYQQLREDLHPFQTFYLSELMIYATDVNLLHLPTNKIQMIGCIRNQIAHSVDFTSSNIDTAGNLIFNFSELSKYVRNISEFFVIYDELLQIIQNNTK